MAQNKFPVLIIVSATVSGIRKMSNSLQAQLERPARGLKMATENVRFNKQHIGSILKLKRKLHKALKR